MGDNKLTRELKDCFRKNAESEKKYFAKKVSGAIAGNFAGLDSNGNLTDSGKKSSDFSKVSVSDTGTATDEISYITIDGVEKKIRGGSGAVDSVNGKTGTVVLDADDISDTNTTNKFVTETEKSNWNAKQNPLSQVTDLTPTSQTLTLSANTRYALGTLTALSLTFPASANDGDEIIIEFVSNSIATTLTLDNTNAIYNFSSVNAYRFIEFNAQFKVSINKWVVYSAETDYSTVGLAYTLNRDNQSYSCSGIGTATATDIVIASVYNGLPVTSIKGDAFKGNTSIISVKIPSSIQAIGDSAFDRCSNLADVVFSDGVSIATGNAGSQFARCKFYNKLFYLPDSITIIPDAFWAYNSKFITLKTKVRLGTNLSEIRSLSFTQNDKLSLIIEANTPPTVTSSSFYDGCSNCQIFVPNASIQQYKVTTNLVTYAAIIYPLVNAVSDLSSIDTTAYTKACVVGNKEYTEYEYTNGQWEVVQ